MGIFQDLCALALQDLEKQREATPVLEKIDDSFRIQESIPDLCPVVIEKKRDNEEKAAKLLFGGYGSEGSDMVRAMGAIRNYSVSNNKICAAMKSGGYNLVDVPIFGAVLPIDIYENGKISLENRKKLYMELYNMTIPITPSSYKKLLLDPLAKFITDKDGSSHYFIGQSYFAFDFKRPDESHEKMARAVQILNEKHGFRKYRYYEKMEWCDVLAKIIMYRYNVYVAAGGLHLIKKIFKGVTRLETERFVSHTNEVVERLDEILGKKCYIANDSLMTDDLYDLVYCAIFDSGLVADVKIKKTVDYLRLIYGMISANIIGEFYLDRIILPKPKNFRVQPDYVDSLFSTVRELVKGESPLEDFTILEQPVQPVVVVHPVEIRNPILSVLLGYMLENGVRIGASDIHVSGDCPGKLLDDLDKLVDGSSDCAFRKWYNDATKLCSGSKLAGFSSGKWRVVKDDEIRKRRDLVKGKAFRVVISGSEIMNVSYDDIGRLCQRICSKRYIDGIFIGKCSADGFVHLSALKALLKHFQIGIGYKISEENAFLVMGQNIPLRKSFGMDLASAYSSIRKCPIRESFGMVVKHFDKHGGKGDLVTLGEGEEICYGAPIDRGKSGKSEVSWNGSKEIYED